MSLTDSATFPTALIKYEKSRINQKIKFPRDTKQVIRKIAIKNGWNTRIVQIMCEKCDSTFLFKVNVLSIPPKTVEISHEWVLTNFKYQEPKFYSRLFNESEKVTFESPPGRTKKD